MPQQGLVIDTPLVNGLRRSAKDPVNAPYLQQCKGLLPTERRLERPPTIAKYDASHSATIHDVWSSYPYPQIFSGKRESFIFRSNAIHSYVESTDTVSATAEKVYAIDQCVNPTSTNNVTNGAPFVVGSWTVSAGVSVSGGNMVFASVANGAGAYQPGVSAYVFGGLYRITVKIDSITAGGIRVRLGSGSETESIGPTWTTADTYEVDLIGSDTDDDRIEIEAVGTTSANIDTISAYFISEATLPTSGGVWQFADFGEVWWAFKRDCVVIKTPFYSRTRAGAGRLVAIVKSVDTLEIQTGCNWNEQLFLGGMAATGDTFTRTEWTTLWETWKSSAPEGVMLSKDMVLKPSTVFFSTPSGGAYDVPFVQELAILDFPARSYMNDDLEDTYLDVIQKRELGFVPLPWQGYVQAILPLGGGVMAYCQDGISLILPRKDGQGFDQVPMLDVGIGARGAVAGDERGHTFVDSYGRMWTIDAQYQMQKLGYEEYFTSAIAAERTLPDTYAMLGCFDKEEGNTYFTTNLVSLLCYVKTPTGLGQLALNFPTALFRRYGTLTGSLVGMSEADTIAVKTLPFNMGSDAQKIINSWSAGMAFASALYGTVAYRNDTLAGTFKDTAAVLSNRSNVFRPGVVGRDFTLYVTATPTANTKLEHLNVSFSMTERKALDHAFNANI